MTLETPPTLSPINARLDAIAAADERDRQQRQYIEAMDRDMRQSCADMADLVEHAKASEFKEIDPTA